MPVNPLPKIQKTQKNINNNKNNNTALASCCVCSSSGKLQLGVVDKYERELIDVDSNFVDKSKCIRPDVALSDFYE